MNISTKFITDNRKARLNRSKIYVEVLQSGQDSGSFSEKVMNLEAIKKDLSSSETSSVISTSPQQFVLIHHLLRIPLPINEMNCFVERTQDREFEIF